MSALSARVATLGALGAIVGLVAWLSVSPTPASTRPEGLPLPGRFADLPLTAGAATARSLDPERMELSWPAGTPWQTALEGIERPMIAGGWKELDKRPLATGVAVSWGQGDRQVGAIIAETRASTRVMLTLLPGG